MLAFVASIVGRVNIAVALAQSSSSIVVMLPMRCPLPSSCPHAAHRHRALLSITVEPSLHRPSPSIAVALKVHRRCTPTVPHRPSPSRGHHASPYHQVAVALSIAIAPRHPSPLSSHPLPSIAINPSIAVELPLRCPLLSITLKSIAVQLPLRRPLPSTARWSDNPR